MGKVEVPIRSIIVVENKNCRAYFCVFSVFPSSPLSRRFSIFSLLLLASSPSSSWTHMVYLAFNSTASFRPVAPLWLRTLPTERALTARNEAVEDIQNNMAVAMMRKENESTLKILNRRDNGKDGKTENTQR